MALSTTPAKKEQAKEEVKAPAEHVACLLYTSDAADEQ